MQRSTKSPDDCFIEAIIPAILFPEDYETEEAFEHALMEAEAAAEASRNDDEQVPEDEEDEEGDMGCASCSGEESVDSASCYGEEGEDAGACQVVAPFEYDDFHVFVYCSVELLPTHERKYYRTEERSIKKGDTVLVPVPSAAEPARGVVQAVEHHMRFSVPQPVQETPEIIGRA